jgi:hypothetical protein
MRHFGEFIIFAIKEKEIRLIPTGVIAKRQDRSRQAATMSVFKRDWKSY